MPTYTQQSVDKTRPSADALLLEARREHRGRLKIFLGAAPGVGKTYEMLSVARRKRAEGFDVVAGIVETHGRAETQALLQDLPQIAPLLLEYRGRQFRELDLDGVLARKPQIALVDELAHTNVPGARHSKRYQDVLELLDAGIDVYTTLNVQHLESFNDLVERITGVEVRETVPDSVFDQATDVELIDLPPDDLIERLRQGKVYIPEQARRALDHYFSKGNLLALRELSFRAAAERIDDDLATFMRAHAIEGPWPARGRILVCVDASPASESLLRATRRLADQRHLPWTAIYVQTLGTSVSTSAQEQLEHNFSLAIELGAETATLTADRVGETVLRYARTHNAAQIVVGRPHAPRLGRWWRGSLAEWLYKQAREFEVTVVPAAEESPSEALQGRYSLADIRHRPKARDYALALVSCAIATALSWFADRWMGIEHLSMIYLVAVTVTGSLAGLLPALVASIACFLSYNFFFAPPRYSFVVARPSDLAALVLFFAVSIVVGQLAGRLRRQAADASFNTERVQTLFEFARRLATAANERDLRLAAASGIEEILGVRCVVLEPGANGRVKPPADLVRDNVFGDTDQAAADWSYAHDEIAGRGTSTLPAASWCFFPVAASGQVFGLLALELPRSSDLPSGEEKRLLLSLQAQLAAAWERFRLRRLADEARLQRATEALRSALLASVSHDLRTPLSSVIGALSAIKDLESNLTQHDRIQLVETALTEAERLNRLIQNLLDATRLAQGGAPLRLGPVALDETVSAAVARLRKVVKNTIEFDIPKGLDAARADRALLEQVLVNLLENAAKYSPASSVIKIAARQEGGNVFLSVQDEGPGIAAADRSRVFDLFFRAQHRDSGVPGSGLGLAICKGFIEAMGGKIAALAGQGDRGTTFELSLPIDASTAQETTA